MDQEIDANTGTDEVAETGSSPADVELQPIVDDDGFVSTTEFREIPKESEPAKAGTSEETEQKTESRPSEKKDFHEHPRFRELIKEKNELAERIAKLEAEKKQVTNQKPQSKYAFKNIMDMEDEAIVDKFSNSPKSFLANFAQQIAHELRTELEVEARTKQEQQMHQTTQQRALQNMHDFFKDREDGISMLKDGTIERFLMENPGHNPISAYHALAGEKVYQAKLEAALKQERERITKELKAAGKVAPVTNSTTTKADTKGPVKTARNKAELKEIMLRNARSRVA